MITQSDYIVKTSGFKEIINENYKKKHYLILWQNVGFLNVAAGSTYNTVTFGLKMVNVKIIISLIILIYSILYCTDIESICRIIRNLAGNIMELVIYFKIKLVYEEVLPSSVFHSRESVTL